MITTVTTATLAATSSVAGWGAALSAGGIILVISTLIALELLDAKSSQTVAAVRKVLRLTATPLVAVFAVSIATKALTILAGG